MIRTLLSAGALVLALGVAAGEAQATTLSKLSVDQMTDASDLVVRGTVTDIWTAKDSDGWIWTHAQLEVSAVLKGDTATSEVVVSQLGGVYMNTSALIEGASRFSIGEEGIFFLVSDKAGTRLSPAGMWQGKYTVRIDPDSGREMGVRFLLSQDAWYDHRFLPHPPVGDRLYVDDLEDEILERVAEGWDGVPIPGADPVKLRRINNLQPGVE
ncbi:MAG TPA: hypothetical protein QGF58_26990 [Myxococcota bacterium]|nr:hypothetical protein [Myxococcota bacterium]